MKTILSLNSILANYVVTALGLRRVVMRTAFYLSLVPMAI